MNLPPRAAKTGDNNYLYLGPKTRRGLTTAYTRHYAA